MKIKFFSAGGTIDKVYFDALSTYEVGDPNINELLKNARITFDFEVVSLMKKDSLDMTNKDRSLICKAVTSSRCDKIIITHGTDTMIETAKFLNASTENKTIVLTGAMEPAKFKTSDAAFNIGFASAAVQILKYGVYICANGRVFNPDHVAKNHTLARFEEKM